MIRGSKGIQTHKGNEVVGRIDGVQKSQSRRKLLASIILLCRIRSCRQFLAKVPDHLSDEEAVAVP